MYNDIVELVTQSTTFDDAGNEIKEFTYKQVFCKLKSVTRNEFYTAAQNGYKPEIIFVLSDYYDYNGAQAIRYDGVMYDVIRTYRTDIELEIVVQRFGDGIYDN